MTTTTKTKKQSCLERKVQSYPHPKNYALLGAYQQVNEMNQSEAVNEILRRFFDSLPESEKRQILQRLSDLKAA